MKIAEMCIRPRRCKQILVLELIKLVALPSTLDKGIFIWAKEHSGISHFGYFVDDVLWGKNKEFSCIIKQLKSTFKIGAERKEVFDYIGFHQNTDYSIILAQDQYINIINLTPISSEQSRQRHRSLTKEETTRLRRALGKLNWVAGMKLVFMFVR